MGPPALLAQSRKQYKAARRPAARGGREHRVRQYLLDLYEIQKIDLGVREQQNRRETIYLSVNKLVATIAELQGLSGSLTEQSRVVRQDTKSLQALVEAEKDKIRKWEARLNDIRNQREYQALQRETEGSKRANRDNEEKISALRARQAALDTELTSAQQRLVDAEHDRDVEQEKVDVQASALEEQIAAQQARRDALVPSIPKALYRTYDSVRGRRMGVGLSLVSQGCCTSCNIRLPPQLYNILQRCETIEQCPSCRRVMCWERILQPPEAPHPDASAGSGVAQESA